MDILDDLKIPITDEVIKPEKPNEKKEKVNMYEATTIKELEIDTDALVKEGHTFAVHVFSGGEDVDVVGEQIAKIAMKLRDKGYVYRWNCDTDDEVASKIYKTPDLKVESYLPFPKFNENMKGEATETNSYEKPYRIAAKYIMGAERFNALKPGVRAINASLVMTMLGIDSNNPIDFLICYSPDGREHMPIYNPKGKTEKVDYAKLGSLGRYLKLAKASGVPVYNFKNKASLVDFVKSYLSSPDEKNNSSED